MDGGFYTQFFCSINGARLENWDRFGGPISFVLTGRDSSIQSLPLHIDIRMVSEDLTFVHFQGIGDQNNFAKIIRSVTG